MVCSAGPPVKSSSRTTLTFWAVSTFPPSRVLHRTVAGVPVTVSNAAVIRLRSSSPGQTSISDRQLYTCSYAQLLVPTDAGAHGTVDRDGLSLADDYRPSCPGGARAR